MVRVHEGVPQQLLWAAHALEASRSVARPRHRYQQADAHHQQGIAEARETCEGNDSD